VPPPCDGSARRNCKEALTRFLVETGDYEERTIAVSDTLLAYLKKYRGKAPNDALIFPSAATQTVGKHLAPVYGAP
jgi:hypothetical protein